ncbi:MAG: RagB/SusD family nutrient uptake outer membrane protein [Pseudobacter sp.]|uniref:RagB/SusD family nutrient uptake outer membrane protein n=1 Tax=Pseudobacter sp. TaxID=2045420 RepID=UPI003F7F25BB
MKSDQSRSAISSLKDLQAILNNSYLWGICGAMSNDAGDEYYISEGRYPNLWGGQQEVYTWEDPGVTIDWANNFQRIYPFNVVLQELDKVKGGSQQERDQIKAQALCHRAFFFFDLAQVYCPPYHTTTVSLPGLPLRMVADVEATTPRSTVGETYERIITDLKEAADKLSVGRPTPDKIDKTTALGMLARAYLAMGDYPNAGIYADKYLAIKSTLVDYNTVDKVMRAPFGVSNPEIAHYVLKESIACYPETYVDSTLYDSYEDGDLRKPIFFEENPDGTHRFKGSYAFEDFSHYAGVATDEMYLIRAECYARAGKAFEAMQDLNSLMEKRWDAATFTPFMATDATAALQLILQERRKELIFRGTRWSDLRRLNLEGANITLTRKINNRTYTLPPNDYRWVFLVPLEVMNMNSWPQNPR